MAARINPYKLFVGAFIPNWLMVRPELTSSAKLVYSRLAQFAGENGKAFPRRETLAVELGLSLGMVKLCLNELRRHGLIETKQRGLGQSNEYYFMSHEWMGLDVADGQPASQRSGQPASHQVVQPASHIRESVEENQYKREVHASRRFLRADVSEVDPIYQPVVRKLG
jgi:DNA-binding transcriptional MocR family regulator